MSGLFQDDTLPEPPAAGPGLFGDSAPAAEPAPVPPPPAPGTPYRVLARKYRPTTFDDLIGQEAMVRTLRNAFALGRIAHAWMLTGVRGVGKTTTARIVAKGLNCIGADGTGGPTTEPCGLCDPCRAIAEGRHVDVMEMDAASRTGVGDIREIIESARYRAVEVTAFSTWAGTLPLLIFAPGLPADVADAGAGSLWAALYIGIFPAAIAYAQFSYAVSKLPVTLATTFLYAVPVFSLFFSWLLLGEVPSSLTLAGGAVALSGIAVVAYAKRRDQKTVQMSLSKGV